MAEGDKGVALAILGVVAVLAVVGLVLLFAQAKTGQVARGGYLRQGDILAGQFDTELGRRATTEELLADPLGRGRDNGLDVERWPTRAGEEKVGVRTGQDPGYYEDYVRPMSMWRELSDEPNWNR